MRDPLTRDRRRLEASYRHGLRVRIGGLAGAKGILFRCERRDGTGHYWKVRLQNGEWVWPDHLVVDGDGDQVATCASCDLPFVTARGSGALICARCDAEQFGAAVDPDRRSIDTYRRHPGSVRRRR